MSRFPLAGHGHDHTRRVTIPDATYSPAQGHRPRLLRGLTAATLLLAVVGALLVGATADAAWTVLLLLAAALAGVTVPDLPLRRVLRIALPVVCAAGWTAGLLGAQTGWWPDATGQPAREAAAGVLIWVASGLALAAALVLAELSRSREVHQRRETARALSHARDVAVADPLTGLANRHGLRLLGGQILNTARRRGDAVYCVFLDVDGLAQVNASLGRSGGDEVLLAVAEALRATTRATDVTARWGDDEFVVVGPGTGLPSLEIERRVRAHCIEHGGIDRRVWQPRVSAGSYLLEPWDDDALDAVLHLADRDMQVRRALRRDTDAPLASRAIAPPPQGTDGWTG